MTTDNRKHLDIAIIQPPGWAVQNPSLGQALLKSYLTENGFSVKNFDLNILLYSIRSGVYLNAWELSNGYYTWGSASYVNKMYDFYSNEILGFIYTVLSFRPKVIGMSVHWSSVIPARLLAQKFKQYSPDTKIVFGGPQVAYYTQGWKALLERGEIDAVVFGEGEESLKCYLESLNSSHNKPIKGVAYSGFKRDIIDGGARELIRSLDSIPFADFSDFDLNLYAGHNVIPTYFSRGCINRCCYCTENKFFPHFRNRTAQRLFDEVVHQLSLYPKTEYFRLHDSISNGNIKELESFCDLLMDNRVKIRFNLENAVIRKEMDGRLYKKLKRAGCTLIGYGLETPSKTLLKHVGKTACLDADFEKVVSDGARNKMTIGINMMFGLPGEKDEDFQEQILFIKKLKKFRKRIIINPALNFCYFPEGCEAHSNPEKFHVDLTNGELYWESMDGRNNFVERLAKFEKFCAAADRLGYKNLFGVTENANRNALLGQYYFLKKDYNQALDYLLKSFDLEIKTMELARDIIKLYAEAHRDPDEAYNNVNSFIASENTNSGHWLNSVNSRQELDGFILGSSISSSMERLNKFIEGRRGHQTVKLRWSLPGLKEYAKQVIFRLLGRTSGVIDDKYVILTQSMKDIDNKIEAALGRYDE